MPRINPVRNGVSDKPSPKVEKPSAEKPAAEKAAPNIVPLAPSLPLWKQRSLVHHRFNLP
jgi:hypothetical protein